MTSAGFLMETVQHDELSATDVAGLTDLFDGEYQTSFGPWNPARPYGYAPHDVHVIARSGMAIVGHVGWARRTIGVGTSEVVIAGVGGVLVSPSARGTGLGNRLMQHAAGSMTDAEGVEFGYLGCREEVVPFYVSCGWHRIFAAERFLSRDGSPVLEAAGHPLLILPVTRGIDSWPHGAVDLRGRAW